MHTNTTAFKLGDGDECLNVIFNPDTARNLISMIELGMQKISDGSTQFYISVAGSSIDSDNGAARDRRGSVFPASESTRVLDVAFYPS